jgi:hypothetical protein
MTSYSEWSKPAFDGRQSVLEEVGNFLDKAKIVASY